MDEVTKGVIRHAFEKEEVLPVVGVCRALTSAGIEYNKGNIGRFLATSPEYERVPNEQGRFALYRLTR